MLIIYHVVFLHTDHFEEGKANQLWKRGKPDIEGYFTIENSEVPEVLTAISESGLEIKGNTLSTHSTCAKYAPIQVN